MAKSRSRRKQVEKVATAEATKPTPEEELEPEVRDFKTAYRKTREKVWRRKQDHRRVRLHRSFRRSYREDYWRELEVPGLLSHSMQSFKVIFKNWKLFLPLVLLATVSSIVFVGLMNQETYQQFQDTIDEAGEIYTANGLGSFAKAGLTLISVISTGGLNQDLDEVEMVAAVIIFLVVWLVTIYLLRQIWAGYKVKLRDGLYNALTPLVSTLAVFIVVLIELIPLWLVAITYSAAVQTEFLKTPFYALVFFIFAAALILLALYLVSSSVMGLVAVTAPGLYPMKALGSASDLMMGRKIRFIIRLLFLAFVVAVVYVLIMMPMILLDMWLASIWDWAQEVPFTSFWLLFTTMFAFVYAATYLYLYYRRMLDYDEKHD